MRRGSNGGMKRPLGTAHAAPARRGDAALRHGSNGGSLQLLGTAHAALVGHALAAPPKTRRRRSAPRLQRQDAATSRYCSRGAGRSCTRRAATDAATPLCAAAPTAGFRDYPVLRTRRWQVMHSPRRHRRGDAALRRGSNGGSLQLLGTAHAALVGHALAAPPKTRRRRSAPQLQRQDATTSRQCSRGAGRSFTRRATKDAATPLCAAAPTAGCRNYPVLHTRRWQVMHSPRRHTRGDAALRRGSNGGSLQLLGTAHAALVGYVLAAPPKKRRRRSAPRLQRRVATTTRHCSRGAGRSCTRRAATDVATPLCAAAPTAGRYNYPALLTRRW
jgi:hypothetical protein